MSSKAMSLKAKIKNYAKNSNIAAQDITYEQIIKVLEQLVQS